jgi:O-antigen/teichoic acid export membrane protein
LNLKSYSLLKSASWYTISKILVLSLSLVAIPIFTHLLTPSDYGVVSLYTVWIGIFTPFIGLGLHLSVFRAKVEFKEKYNEYISSIVSLVFLLFVFSSILFFIFKTEILAITKIPAELFLYLIIQVGLSIFISIGLGVLQFQFRYKLVSFLSVVRAIFSLLFSVLLILYFFAENEVNGKIAGVFIVEFILGGSLVAYLLYKGKVLFNYTYWKFGLVYSIPFIFGSLSFILNSQFDRILINEYMGSADTGLYSFAYSIGMLLLLIGVSVKQALNPWVYEKLDGKNIIPVKKIYKQFIHMFSLITILMLYVSPELVKLFSAESFWGSASIVPWIVLGAYFQLLILNEQETQMFLKKTALNSLIIVVGALVNIALNFLFIPKYGVLGAAITTLVTYIFMFVSMYYINLSILKYPLVNFKTYIFSISCVLFFSLLYFIIQHSFLLRLGVGCIILIALLRYIYVERNSFIIAKNN